MRLPARIQARLRRVNPTAVVGAVLLLTGIGIAVLGVGLSAGIHSSATLTGALTGLMRQLAAVINRGDDTLRDAQATFNGVVYQVLLEQLPPGLRRAVSVGIDALAAIVADLCSLTGIATLVALLLGCPLARRLAESREPGPRPRA